MKKPKTKNTKRIAHKGVSAEDKRICPENNNLPERTIFSINPATGQPYCTYEYAENLVYKHINLTCKNLLTHHDAEDIKQEMLLKLCYCTYDPSKSAVNTFIIMCSKSHAARIYEHTFKVREKFRESGDFVMFDNDGDEIMATEHLGVEDVTPEDYLAAKQLHEEFVTQNEKAKKRAWPQGWNGLRALKVPCQGDA